MIFDSDEQLYSPHLFLTDCNRIWRESHMYMFIFLEIVIDTLATERCMAIIVVFVGQLDSVLQTHPHCQIC